MVIGIAQTRFGILFCSIDFVAMACIPVPLGGITAASVDVSIIK